MKKFLVVSDSFKGTLSSLDICHIFQETVKNKPDYEFLYLPVADGGEGSLEAISYVLKGKFINLEVHNLYLEKINVSYFIDDKNNAYIEASSCVGLINAKKDNDPGKVYTVGLGEQILDAINKGIKNINILLGGTASNDAGTGLAYALGAKFYDENNQEFLPNGLTLNKIKHIDLTNVNEIIKDININALCDVYSPFYGQEGASYKFAPQKGASPIETKLLDDNLRYFANIIKKDLNIDLQNIPGTGAAGGLGGGLLSLCKAQIKSGIETILNLMDFDHLLDEIDYVISGEGKLDKQTFNGKLVDGIAKRCLRKNKPLYLIVGSSTLDIDEIKINYPCIKNIYETNEKHLPFENIKNDAENMYQQTINKFLNNFK